MLTGKPHRTACSRRSYGLIARTPLRCRLSAPLAIALSAFVGSSLPIAAEPEQQELAAANDIKAQEILRIEAEIQRLEQLRKEAAHRRQLKEAKRLAGELRVIKESLKVTTELPAQQIAARLRKEKEANEALAKAASEQIAKALADKQAAERIKQLEEKYGQLFEEARKAAGCPLVVKQINAIPMTREIVMSHINHGSPGYMWFDAEFVPGTPREGHYVRLTVQNKLDIPIEAWEIRVEAIDVFNDTLGRVDHRGAKLDGSPEQFVVTLPMLENTAGARAIITRVAMPDGKIWLRKDEHLGISVRRGRADGGRMITDVEDADRASDRNEEARRPAGRGGDDGLQERREADANDSLTREEKLTAGKEITASDGVHALLLTANGSLVLYRKDTNESLWATDTAGSNAVQLVVQDDGNVVLSRSDGVAVWAAESQGRNGSRLVVQSDGNLVLYAGDSSVWATNTSGQ